MFLQTIFIKETNNYTKRILQSHTDHYHYNRAMNWKKLTTVELNIFIPCQRSKKMKNKSHMLVHKTHHSYFCGSMKVPRDNFQLNLTCFHMVAKKHFASVLDAFWRSVVCITTPTISPRKRTPISAEQVARLTKQLV